MTNGPSAPTKSLPHRRIAASPHRRIAASPHRRIAVDLTADSKKWSLEQRCGNVLDCRMLRGPP
jgi:hypothetical protein